MLMLHYGRYAAKYCDERVSLSLSVRVSVRKHISETTCPIFTKFSEHFIDGHGYQSWQRCDILCISGLWTTFFSDNGPCYGCMPNCWHYCCDAAATSCAGYRPCCFVLVASCHSLRLGPRLHESLAQEVPGAESAVNHCLVQFVTEGSCSLLNHRVITHNSITIQAIH